MRILSKEEATTVERPENDPWVWPKVVYVMVSDSHKVWPQFNLTAANGDPLQEAYAVNFLETLYARGYAVVKLEYAEATT